jgi:hypothetical protein
MTAALLFLLGTASATDHALGLSIGSHTSQGLKTQISVTGFEGSLVYQRRGDGTSGVQIELQDLWSDSPSGPAHLLGVKVGWTKNWTADEKIYSLLSVGGYANEILPVLPILFMETGLKLGEGALRWRVGPELYALPPFFIGGGLRVTATTSLGGSK